MRKLLLATVAALGASMGVASVADAQTASPAPGTVTVRLNGRVRFYGGIVVDKQADNNSNGSATGNVGANGEGTLPGRNKLTNYTFGNYARLFPGFDGVAANGLKYGASLEIRQDNTSGAGGGIAGSISSNTNRRAALYFRREWGYIGTDQLGTLRFGTTDQPSSLYMTGNFENFNDGGLDGDAIGFAAGNLQVTWPFADVGNYYATTKAVYLSPQLYGLDFGVSYEPNSGGANNGNNCGATGSSPTGSANFQAVSGPGCDRLASSPFNAESSRRRNTVDALLRYRGTFGGFGIAATGGYIGGSHVLDNSGNAFSNNPFTVTRNPTTGANVTGPYPNYDGLSVGDFGLALTYAGFSIGGKYQFGRFNGQWGLAPKGLPDGEAILVGASYTVGPLVVGAHYLDYKSAGDAANAFFGRQRREQGFAAGGTYSLAPGLSLFASYVYNQRKQSGYNFLTNQGVSTAAGAGTGGNPYNNKVTSQVFALGTGFSW